MSSRYPTLDEIESGHDSDSAYSIGDIDALDAIDAATDRAFAEVMAR